MKKLLYIILIIILLLSLFGCAKEKTPIIRIATLAGPTGMGMTKLIDNADEKYEINIYTTPDQLTAKIINNEIDICAVPSNLAALLYNKTNKGIKVLSINTVGVLYVIGKDERINRLDDLKGKTLYVSGQGASTEYILTSLLNRKHMVPGTDIDIIYVPTHTDLANMIAADEVEFALLPEPYVSIALAKNSELDLQININYEWQEFLVTTSYGSSHAIPMGVTIVQKEFLENYPEAVESFMIDYEKSIEFVEYLNEEASILIAEQGILPNSTIALDALPRCGISFITDGELEEILNKYLELIHNISPESIGGALPDEDFYYNSN